MTTKHSAKSLKLEANTLNLTLMFFEEDTNSLDNFMKSNPPLHIHTQQVHCE